MSIINCKYCDEYIDTDYDTEHENECKYKPTGELVAVGHTDKYVDKKLSKMSFE